MKTKEIENSEKRLNDINCQIRLLESFIAASDKIQPFGNNLDNVCNLELERLDKLRENETHLLAMFNSIYLTKKGELRKIYQSENQGA
ncbi:MAG: hypothetical protein EBR30_14045 [Cytophagia bacterium]|nr:hypothetical protein [Cytophagia bacterium]